MGRELVEVAHVRLDLTLEHLSQHKYLRHLGHPKAVTLQAPNGCKVYRAG